MSLPLEALKERGDIVAKFAYANWSRQELATRQMAENAVQMVQRNPSPRGDKNGADINLALDALEMAFTHEHVNAFAIVSGDSDFIPLVNKLKEYGKTVFVVGGKAFTSTILQQNCHEFISYESLLSDGSGRTASSGRRRSKRARVARQRAGCRCSKRSRRADGSRSAGDRRDQRSRPAPLDLAQAMPLVERALQVLERRGVQPQLGLLKSTMLQLDSTFSERAYGCGQLLRVRREAEESRLRQSSPARAAAMSSSARAPARPDVARRSPRRRCRTCATCSRIHRLEIEDGVTAEDLAELDEHRDHRSSSRRSTASRSSPSS